MISGWMNYFTPSEIKPLQPAKRIEKRTETVNILSLIAKLHKKETQLKEDAAKYGSDSIDYRKHLVVANLLAKIDEKIETFNQLPASLDPRAEIVSLITLSHTLTAIVEKVINDYSVTLEQPRNAKFDAIIDISSAGVAAGTSALLGLPGVITVGALLTGPALSNQGKKALGKAKSATSGLLSDLLNSLKQMTQNLSLALNLGSSDEKETETPSEFVCPITKKIMTDPAFCRLDNQTYEKEAITKYLLEQQQTPLGQSMAPIDTIENVLSPNPSVKSLIDKHLSKHPKLFDEESTRLNKLA